MPSLARERTYTLLELSFRRRRRRQWRQHAVARSRTAAAAASRASFARRPQLVLDGDFVCGIARTLRGVARWRLGIDPRG